MFDNVVSICPNLKTRLHHQWHYSQGRIAIPEAPTACGSRDRAHVGPHGWAHVQHRKLQRPDHVPGPAPWKQVDGNAWCGATYVKQQKWFLDFLFHPICKQLSFSSVIPKTLICYNFKRIFKIPNANSSVKLQLSSDLIGMTLGSTPRSQKSDRWWTVRQSFLQCNAQRCFCTKSRQNLVSGLSSTLAPPHESGALRTPQDIEQALQNHTNGSGSSYRMGMTLTPYNYILIQQSINLVDAFPKFAKRWKSAVVFLYPLFLRSLVPSLPSQGSLLSFFPFKVFGYFQNLNVEILATLVVTNFANKPNRIYQKLWPKLNLNCE